MQEILKSAGKWLALVGGGGLVNAEIGRNLLLGAARLAAGHGDVKMERGGQRAVLQPLFAVSVAAAPHPQQIAQNPVFHGGFPFPAGCSAFSISQNVVFCNNFGNFCPGVTKPGAKSS